MKGHFIEVTKLDYDAARRTIRGRLEGEVAMRTKTWKALSSSLLGLAMVAAAMPRAAQAQSNKADAAMKLKVGDQAPEFKLQYFDGSGLKDVTLSQYHGKKNVLLAFYVFAFTGG
jgi:hypothetical protein